MNESNALNLKLFKAPKPLTPDVKDFAVPVLLKPEEQVQLFNWDLTINWIVPFIDGVKTTKGIAEASEVDIEMVRACLRGKYLDKTSTLTSNVFADTSTNKSYSFCLLLNLFPLSLYFYAKYIISFTSS